MKQITVMEKYPVFTLRIEKRETDYGTIDGIFTYLKVQIDLHPIATYIGEFDHYGHTSSLESGEISDEITAAKNLLCCFGKVLPKPEVLAVHPRSIAVAELEDAFVVSFLEAPNQDANKAMEQWVKGLITV